MKPYNEWTLQEAKKHFKSALSADSFKHMEANLVPMYKLLNAQRGNIYSETLNNFWIQEDKDRAKDCRDEYYRVSVLIDAAQTKEEVAAKYNQKDFESIVRSELPE
jgi:hypothetical protein